MRKLTPSDRIEEIFMEASAEDFSALEERIAMIRRLRKLDRKPRPKRQSNGQRTLISNDDSRSGDGSSKP